MKTRGLRVVGATGTDRGGDTAIVLYKGGKKKKKEKRKKMI